MNMFQGIKDKVAKQNQATRERLEDLREKVIDVKLAAKMAAIKVQSGVSSAADETIDMLASTINPAAMRATYEAAVDEEAELSEEQQRAKLEAQEAKRNANAQKVAHALASVHETFFSPPEQADPLREVLMSLPPKFEDEHLRAEEEHLATVVSIAGTELSAQIQANYGQMVQGIGTVSDVMQHLQTSVIVAKNARRTLARAQVEVESAITIGKGTRKKASLLKVLDVLHGLSGILAIDTTLKAALAQGRHVDAVLAYAEAHAQLQTLGHLTVAGTVRDGMVGLLYTLVRSVEDAAVGHVANFRVDTWPAVFDAYVLLGEEVKPLGDRLLDIATKAIDAAAEEALRAATAERAAAELARMAAESGSAAAKKLAFKDLCRLLPKTQTSYRTVVGASMGALFAILASVQRMYLWHRARFEELGGVWTEVIPSGPPPPKWAQDPRSGYFYDSVSGCHWDPKTKMYYDPKSKAWGSEGPPPPGSQPPPAAPPAAAAPAASHADGPSIGDAEEQPQSAGQKAAAAAAAAHMRHQSRTSSGDAAAGSSAANAMAAGEKALCEAVARAVDMHRRTLWDLASQRLAQLLTCPCAPNAPGVIRLLAVARRFAAAGEGFARSDAPVLRQHIAGAADRYFESLHRQRLEALQAKLDAETWVALTGDAASSLRASLLDAAASLAGLAAGNAAVPEPQGVNSATQALFDACLAEGNPFAECGNCAGPAWDVVGAEEGARAQAAADAAKADPAFAAMRADKTGLQSEKPVVTAASSYALSIATEYIRLLRQLKGSPAVFTGLTHLFEFSLLAVFRTFGQVAALQGGQASALQAAAGGPGAAGGAATSPAGGAQPSTLTPRLRNTLQRVAALQVAAKLVPASAAGGGDGSAMAPGMAGAHAAAGGAAPTQLHSSGNLYGLPQRSVATEALACFGGELKRLKPVLRAALPADVAPKLDGFFVHSVDAVPDLREHVYAHVARQLVSLAWLPEAVGDADSGIAQFKDGKYELKSLDDLDASQWAAKLVAEFKAFGTRLAACDMAPEAAGAMWDNATSAAAEQLLHGLARVKKCTPEGRALMGMDVQTVASSIKRMAPAAAKPELAMRAVDAFVKAFYVPEQEVVTWVQTHPEYTAAQVTALVNQMAHGFKWSRQQRQDLLTKLEGELAGR
jgi:hypothetical protein